MLYRTQKMMMGAAVGLSVALLVPLFGQEAYTICPAGVGGFRQGQSWPRLRFLQRR